jgi:Tfp pilus assembly protein PilO
MFIDRTIIIALIFAAIIFMVYLVVLPEYKEYKELQIKLGEKIAEAAQKYDYYAAVDKAYYELQSKKEELKNIDSALQKNSDFGKVMYFLNETAKESNFVVRNLLLSKSGASSDQSVKNINFSMDLTGDYDALKYFMKKIEESSRIFEITSISFQSGGGVPYNFNLQIKTYSY